MYRYNTYFSLVTIVLCSEDCVLKFMYSNTEIYVVRFCCVLQFVYVLKLHMFVLKFVCCVLKFVY